MHIETLLKRQDIPEDVKQAIQNGIDELHSYYSNVLDSKQTDIALRESEEKFKAIFDNALDGILLVDIESKKFFMSNKKLCQMLGYSLEEIKDLGVMDIHPSDSLSYVLEQFDQQTRNEITLAKNIPILRKDKTIFYADINSSLITLGGKNYLLGIFRDITEQRQTEKEFKESEEKFRLISEQSIFGIMILQEGLVKYVNNAIADIIEYSPKEMLDWAPNEFIKTVHPDDRPFVIEQARKKQLGESDTLTRYSIRLVTKTGKAKWIENHSKTTMYKGKPADLITIIDTTSLKKAEDELKESEERYRSVVENSHAGIVITDDKYNVIYSNDQGLKISERTRDEVINQDFTQFFDKENGDKIVNYYTQRQRGEKVPSRYEAAIIIRNGKKRPIEISSTSIKDSQGRRVTITQILDITERKRVEQELRASEEKFRNLIMNLTDTIIETDSEWNFTYVSPQVQDLFGFQADELIGRNILDIVHPDDLELTTETIRNIWVYGLISEFEYRLIHKTGYDIHVSTTSRIIHEGKNVKIVSIIRNITERKGIEKAKHDLENRRKKFIEMTSHELRTPMTCIKGFVEVLQKQEGDFSSTHRKKCYNILNKNIARFELLINDVSDLSKLDRNIFELNPKKVKFIDFLDNEINNFKILLGDQLELNSYLEESDQFLQVLIDKDRIHQVFENIINNATKQTLEETRQIVFNLRKIGKIIQIEISDNGIGIESHNLKRIFDPFVSIKTEYSVKGTGIGLNISRTIIEKHGGTIHALSDGIGKGATFVLKLPIE